MRPEVGRRSLSSGALATLAALPGALAVALSLSLAAPAAAQPEPGTRAGVKASREHCALLDDPSIKGRMDGRLRMLLVACGREYELGGVRQEPAGPALPGAGPSTTDVQVNDSSGDSGSSHTQSENSIAINEVTGTLCAGFNDSNGLGANGFTGFSRSIDGGATWTDQGALGNNSGGDPSVVWRQSDGHFYFTALENVGLGIWRSTDDCQTFTFLGNTHVSGGDDKELLAVDNTGGTFHGRLYVAWTDFNAGGRIFVNFSDNGTTWSTALAVSAVGEDVQGAWPTVAPNGDVYVGWNRWNPFPAGPIDIEIVRSTNGGVSFTPVTNPMTGEVNPRDSAATASCGRPALKANIRYLPSPQLAVGPNGDLHAVYSYDQDGFNTGDVVDVFYRRSTNDGATWEPEIQLNDDGTTTDQFFPTLSVGASNVVSAAWYDRRLDTANNTMLDYFQRFSFDGGVTWQPSIRISDVSTPVFLDPNLATCYHGDYDWQIQPAGAVHMVWSDDRNMQGGHNDPDAWSQSLPAGVDFLLLATPTSVDVCSPNDANYTIDVPQFQGFVEPVTLASTGEPAGTTVMFGTNPVTPPGSSTMTVTNTGAASPGSYTINVTGTSSPSTIVHDTDVGLNLFGAVPGSVTLTAPADGATNQALAPTLTWSAATQGTSYDVEVATDAGFTNVVYSATVAGTSHTLGTALDPITQYFWHVRGTNVCGNGAFSTAFSFTTRAIPPFLLVDDDDNATDVRPTYEAALTALGVTYDVWNTANSDNEPSALDLSPYHTVIWFTGHEFGGAAGPGATSEGVLAAWLDGGNKCFFISSQDYHFDRNLTPFMTTHLGTAAVADDTSQTTVTGTGTFAGLGPYTLVYPFSNFSDTMTASGGGQVSFTGNAGNAALRRDGGVYRTHFFGYPWEAISTPANRQAVMQRVLEDCAQVTDLILVDGFESGDTSAWSETTP
jgi:hypothetical protein